MNECEDDDMDHIKLYMIISRQINTASDMTTLAFDEILKAYRVWWVSHKYEVLPSKYKLIKSYCILKFYVFFKFSHILIH
jgi:hypothetical protein